METMELSENGGPLDVSIKKENTQEDGTIKPKMDIDKYCVQFSNDGQMVEALKSRIRELESVSKLGSDKFTCLLCKVSTTKRHLHKVGPSTGCNVKKSILFPYFKYVFQ